ncbi:MAG: hypothetical protein K2X97_08725 [Mycobacteriaceae bacterium]|nr:hypothetical protein [Mycobacteriaceae bacterium]
MADTVTVNDVFDGHVGLDLECMDRIYLNGYVPNLQVSGQVAAFMTAHLGYPIPSPAIMEKIGTAFRTAVDRFADDNKIPVVRFGKDDRKIDRMRPYLARQAATCRSGVAAIGVAQEFAPVFLATKKGAGAAVWFSFTKAQRRVTCYYFYLWDDDFGPAFMKVCAYFPYPMKIWVNGHEWAKRQAAKAGIGFTELSNGFASCTDPTALQTICDRLGPGTIQVFAERWWSILPLPLTEHDRAAGYWWELSMRQVETSRILVFDAPRHARGFFEALVTDNLDIGRPEVIELIFKRGRRRGRPAAGEFKTKVLTYGTEVNVNAFYRHSRIKQYLKDGRALRIETVINDRATWAVCGGWRISMSCRPAPVQSTPPCSILNVSVRAASWRVQPLSGSPSPPSPRMAGRPRPYGSATLGSTPWPAPCVPACSPSPASPTRACAP